jgi:hypothetical protein
LVAVLKISVAKNRQFKLFQKPQKVGKLHEGIIKRKPLSRQLFHFLQFCESFGYTWEPDTWYLSRTLAMNLENCNDTWWEFGAIFNTHPTPICTYKFAHDIKMFKSVVKGRLLSIGLGAISDCWIFHLCEWGGLNKLVLYDFRLKMLKLWTLNPKP